MFLKIVPGRQGNAHGNIFEQFIFIKVTGCSLEFHSKRVPLQLFLNKVLQVLYSSFVVLSMGFYLKPQNFVRKKNNQVFVKESPLSIIGSCVEKWC